MSLIYHLAKAGVWADAQQSGEAYSGAVEDTADGFLHFSTAGQIIESAARHRAGERDLVLLAVDADGLGDDCAGSGRAAARSSRIYTAPCRWRRCGGRNRFRWARTAATNSRTWTDRWTCRA